MENQGKHLATFLSECAKIDLSTALREIVDRNVTVNNEIVDDPNAKLIDEHGVASFVGYRGSLYAYYP